MADDSPPSSTDPTSAAVPDERVGQYARLEEIGRGAQSRVWLAIDSFLEREVALKEILPPRRGLADGSEPTTAWNRFLREARLTAKLDHPSIVPIHEIGRRFDGTLFCAQKLIRGETLKARMAACDGLDARLALLPHLIDACQAMAYAHSRGVIHRDLKPSNIMVGSFGETVVVDWGLAKERDKPDEHAGDDAAPSAPELTMVGVSLGTPSYMSPEAVRGAVAEIDERSDVFGLGVILYEMLTGRLPFEGIESTQVMAVVVEGRFRPVREVCPEAPAELAAVAERALQHEPADRYPGAGPLAKELSAYRAGGRVTAYEYRSWELVKKFVARNLAASMVSMAALLILIGASIAIGWQLHHARLSLARSFLERARAAAKSSDWARAAGYYAASRVQSDSREGRWGVALASEKMPLRVLARTGAPGSAASVGFLADGRGLVLAFEPGAVVGRELDSGRELWRLANPEQPIFDYGLSGSDGRQVYLRFPDALRYLDATTGAELGKFDGKIDIPCGFAPVPARASLVSTPDGYADLVVRTEGAPERTLMRGLRYLASMCVLTSDGKEVALVDRTGTVHLWNLAEGTEITTRRAPDASDLIFTAHGLAIVRERSVQLVGDDGNDLIIGTPGHHASGLFTRNANAVSADGHLLVVGRMDSNSADLIDLRTRQVSSSISYAPGRPRFAFSRAGDRLFAAGLADNSTVVGWDIRQKASPPAVRGTNRMNLEFTRDGQRLIAAGRDGQEYRVVVHDLSGRPIFRRSLGEISQANAAISGDGSRVFTAVTDSIAVFDVESDTTLARFDCRSCLRGQFTHDGSRLLTSNGTELVVWDLERKEAIWRDSKHPGNLREAIALSPDGRRVGYARGDRFYVVTVGGEEREVKPGGQVDDLIFDRSSSRIAVVTTLAIGVYELDGMRPIFLVPNPTWVSQYISWAVDGSAVLVLRDNQGSTLLDSTTGVPFAEIAPTSSSVVVGEHDVSPDLRHTVSSGDGLFQILPLPPPDETPPSESLARILDQAGLEMNGVELVYAAAPTHE